MGSLEDHFQHLNILCLLKLYSFYLFIFFLILGDGNWRQAEASIVLLAGPVR